MGMPKTARNLGFGFVLMSTLLGSFFGWFMTSPSKHVTLVYEADQQLPEGQHVIHALVLECMDPRFHGNTSKAVVAGLNTSSFDLLAFAGGSLGFSDPIKGKEYWKNSILDHVEASLQLHHIHEFDAIDHMQCGAYKLRYGSMSPERELKLHEANLRRLRNDFRRRFPKLKVRLFIAKIVKKDDKIVHEYHEVDPIPEAPQTPELRAHQPQAPPEHNVH